GKLAWLLVHGSILSRVGASTKSGAVQIADQEELQAVPLYGPGRDWQESDQELQFSIRLGWQASRIRCSPCFLPLLRGLKSQQTAVEAEVITPADLHSQPLLELLQRE
ncbi:hypothetical protein, partial [Burkholderia sp. SIMBA_062]|uniref:hypothetical protein n=1 Tax=Burkholderia sp. SIMBA_062 TaxID=3085803 RepID=UPI003978A7A6